MTLGPAVDLDLITRQFRENPALRAKAELRLVSEVLGPSDWLAGPGDDAAALPDGDGHLLVAGEAIFPPFVEADPEGAGIASVLANVNDVAAMGGRPLAIVDTIVAPEPIARAALVGMRRAAALHRVPIVGGHLTVREGPPSLSAFVLGRAQTPLSATRAAAGQTLLLACALDGEMRRDFPFFSAIRQRGERAAGDVALLAEAADRGLCAAAKDVSMAGLLGSLGMLLEPNRLGAMVDLDRVPRPADVALDLWLRAFPSFIFLLCADPDRVEDCRALFASRGLTCEAIGTLDGSARLRARLGSREALLLDLAAEIVTGIATAPS
jgi:selenophosphate synthetase-related protein